MKVKLGWRLDLDKLPITSMAASIDGNPALAPGEKSRMIVQMPASDGKIYLTEGAGKGKILWKELTVTSSVVSADKKGNLSLLSDPRLSEGQIGHVTITAPTHPGLSAEIDVPIRYDYAYGASFTGFSGNNGLDGTSGIDGTSGLPGSTDPNNPSAGGNGSDGSSGGNGSNGGDGWDGPAVTVRIAMHPDMHPGGTPLLEAAITTGKGKESLYLIDPQGGSLTVSTTGGSGGKGGKGGRGGRGGSGGIGSPNGSSGHDGSNGSDGHDGSDGRGGAITIVYDPQVQPYLDVIHTNNPGGPRPEFLPQSVPPLW